MSVIKNQDFTISRDLAAPRPLVFDCITKPEHMRNWWGPKGVTIVKSQMDFRVGGLYHYGMRQPDGQVQYGRMMYREIVAPERIVFINSFADAEGNLARHPFAEAWPLEMHSIFLFEDLGNERTRFTVKWTPWNATDEERATFAAGHASMNNGWSGTLDQFEAYLATVNP